MRMISGPQGPRVVLDGKPVLLLCSDNYLGLADHPRVREAAAEAALRWGAGAGSSRAVAGTMTLHRRLEERLAEFHQTDAALLFGAAVIPALAGRGQAIFADALNHPALADGCRLSGADIVEYEHADPDHLAWTMRQHPGRGALVVTEGVFGMDGDVAPLPEIVALAQRHGVRVLVDESHAVGALGPDGRGTVAEAGLEDEVDVLLGSLEKALGGSGAYVACDRSSAALIEESPTFRLACAPSPPAVAAGMAALEEVTPRRIDKLLANAAVLRSGLDREGFDVTGSTQIVPLVVGDAANAVAARALDQGVFVEAVEGRLRLTVMASHTRSELREAAQVLGRAALQAGVRPATMVPVAEIHAGGTVVPFERAA
jgi:glycine C-acetyltransferase/8-amino-7-oxononanoate synthase